jgi:hypothetical protein
MESGGGNEGVLAVGALIENMWLSRFPRHFPRPSDRDQLELCSCFLLLFGHENESSMLLRNVDNHILNGSTIHNHRRKKLKLKIQ